MRPGGRPQRRYVCTMDESSVDHAATLNIEVLGGGLQSPSLQPSSWSNSDAQAWAPSSSDSFVPVNGRFGTPHMSCRSQRSARAGHNCLQESLDWTKIDCHDFLRLAKEVSAEDLFECIINDKLYSKTGERTWDLTEFVLQRKDRRMFIGGQGVVLFVRRQGHSTSLAMKICYHKREEKKVERHVQRTILHLKGQGVSQFVGRILVNYLTRRFFVTVMPKAKFASLKSLKQELGPLSEASIRYYFACVTSAVIKLHSIQICHRDIKCDNVLVMHNGAPALIDFGLAVKGAQTTNEYKPNTRATQMQYYPPETKAVGNQINDYKIDSWLLGFFMCEMLFPDREHLWNKFRATSQKDWCFMTCNQCRLPNNPALTPMLTKLLTQSPNERMLPADLQYMPYLQDGGFLSDIETMSPPSLPSGQAIDRVHDTEISEG